MTSILTSLINRGSWQIQGRPDGESRTHNKASALSGVLSGCRIRSGLTDLGYLIGGFLVLAGAFCGRLKAPPAPGEIFRARVFEQVSPFTSATPESLRVWAEQHWPVALSRVTRIVDQPPRDKTYYGVPMCWEQP